MAYHEDLKAAVAAVIKQNNSNDITGNLLQNVLLTIIDSLGKYSNFAGVASPSSVPGLPDEDVFYLATAPGVYPNYGGIEISTPGLYIIEKEGLAPWTIRGLVNIVDSLESNSNTSALSASQGLLLKSLVDSKINIERIADNLITDSSNYVLSAKQGKILHDLIEGFASQIGTGIIGEALPDTEPIETGFAIYTVSTPGVYSNFKDINGESIEVEQAQIDGNLVQIWGNNNIWEVNLTPVQSNLPTSTHDTFIIL